MSDEYWFSDEEATFGDRLAGAREAAGMDQKDLAKRIGVKLSTVRNWENDLAEPRAQRLSQLSGLLNVSLRWLLMGEGNGPDAPDDVIMPSDIADVLLEMTALRTEMRTAADRLAILEKRLRMAMLEELEPTDDE